jgi:hypothetical protein
MYFVESRRRTTVLTTKNLPSPRSTSTQSDNNYNNDKASSNTSLETAASTPSPPTSATVDAALEASILEQKRERERKHGLRRLRELLSTCDAVMSVSSLWLNEKSKTNKFILALDFIDWHLRSFSQVVFINNSISGLVIMISLLAGDWRQVRCSRLADFSQYSTWKLR